MVMCSLAAAVIGAVLLVIVIAVDRSMQRRVNAFGAAAAAAAKTKREHEALSGQPRSRTLEAQR